MQSFWHPVSQVLHGERLGGVVLMFGIAFALALVMQGMPTDDVLSHDTRAAPRPLTIEEQKQQVTERLGALKSANQALAQQIDQQRQHLQTLEQTRVQRMRAAASLQSEFDHLSVRAVRDRPVDASEE